MFEVEGDGRRRVRWDGVSSRVSPSPPTARSGGALMSIAFNLRHLSVGAHHRLWLIVTAIAAFIMAALWTRPAG